jgi:hypothetical protein
MQEEQFMFSEVSKNDDLNKIGGKTSAPGSNKNFDTNSE